MFRKIILSSFVLLGLVSVILPSKKENTQLFNYCYSLEKILSRNSFQKKNNISGQLRSISKDILRLGVNKTKGDFVNKIIDQYKISKNSKIIKFIPNKIYCLGGYWIENVKPGTFESIFYEKSKNTINEFKDLKDEVDEFLNDINSEYKYIKKEFNKLF